MHFKIKSVEELLPGDNIRIKEGRGIKGSGQWLQFERMHPWLPLVFGKVWVGGWRRGAYKSTGIKVQNLDMDAHCFRGESPQMEQMQVKRRELFMECLIS